MRRLPTTATITLLALAGCSHATDVAPPPPTSSAPETSAVGPETRRSALADGVTQVPSCAEGSVKLSTAGVTARLPADCAKVVIDAPGIILLAEGIGKLEVDGSTVTVIARSIESVVLTSPGNQVYWDIGAPEVLDLGTGSTLRTNPTPEDRR